MYAESASHVPPGPSIAWDGPAPPRAPWPPMHAKKAGPTPQERERQRSLGLSSSKVSIDLDFNRDMETVAAFCAIVAGLEARKH